MASNQARSLALEMCVPREAECGIPKINTVRRSADRNQRSRTLHIISLERASWVRTKSLHRKEIPDFLGSNE